MGTPNQQVLSAISDLTKQGQAAPVSPTISAQASPDAWHQFASSLPPETPDSAYDALRDQFFQQRVMPELMQHGYGSEAGRTEWMKRTERPNKSEWPRLRLMGVEAEKSLLDPVYGISGLAEKLVTGEPYAATAGQRAQEGLALQAKEAEIEATKQGIWSAPYSLAGQALGAAPYFAAPLGKVGGVGEKVADFIGEGAKLAGAPEAALSEAAEHWLQRGINTATVSVVQGAYDAASAQNGTRVTSGMKGAAAGAAFAGATEGVLGGIADILRSKGVPDEVAEAVGKVAKGTASPSETSLAASAVAQVPDLGPQIAQQVQTLGKASEAVGVPEESTAEGTQGKVKITMRGADGKFYNLFGKGSDGMDLGEFGKIVPTLVDHLNNGGVVRQVRGDPGVVNAFYGMIEDLQAKNGKFDFKLPGRAQPLKNDAAGVPEPVTPVVKEEPEGETADLTPRLSRPLENTPAPFASDPTGLNAPTNEPPPTDDLEANLAQSIKQAKLIKERNQRLISGQMSMKDVEDEMNLSKEPLVRGNANLPLNEAGHLETLTTGAKLASKGGLDEIHMADLTRHMQTAQNIAESNPDAQMFSPNPGLRSWGKGFAEGQPESDMLPMINDYIRDAPDLPIPGSKESFNQASSRILGTMHQLMDKLDADPTRKIGVVTSSTDVGMMRAHTAVGAPDDLSLDQNVMMRSHENPGDAYRVARDENGQWQVRHASLDSDSDLRGGIYMIRHGETDWNAPAEPSEEEPTSTDVSYKETPLAHRYHGDLPFLEGEGARGASLTPFPGEKPSLFYSKDADKQTLFHENLHGHFGYMGLRQDVQELLNQSGSVAHDLATGLVGDAYPDFKYGDKLEEAYVHAASAIRVGDDETLDAFGEADTSKEHVLDWVTDTSRQIQDLASESEDSLHKRTLERRINAVINRSSSQIEDLRRNFVQTANDVRYERGQYVVNVRPGETRYFDSREDALTFLEPKQEPLNVPELVSMDLLPDGVPRLSKDITPPSFTRPPITTDPPEPPARRQGLSLLGRYLRPFYDWIQDVSVDQNRPDLWQAFSPIDRGQVEMNNFTRPYTSVLAETLGSFDHDRQTDLFNLLSAHPDQRADVAREFRFSDEELNTFDDFNSRFLEPLKNELGFDLGDYLQNILPRLRGNGVDIDASFPKRSLLPETAAPEAKSEIWKQGLSTGELSPHDTNLSRIAAAYLRMGAREKFLGDTLNKAADLVNEKNEDGSWKLGLLRTPLARHIEYLRGAPDYTQQVMESVGAHTMDLINAGIDKVNGLLPGEQKIPSLDMAPREAFSKLILMSYAGELALKPALVIRDLAQLFLTTFPVLGNYTWTGMKRMFPAVGDMLGGGWESKDIFDIPRKYGALIEKRDWESVTGEEGPMSRFAEKALSFINFSHNVNRVVAFWGHEAKTTDALESFFRHGDAARFERESGSWFMKAPMRAQYTREAQMLGRDSGEEALQDYSRRMAKDMTELTQWNFKRGSMPGVYEYQLGRLFGQYGTWPLNYWEYARRFVQGSDKGEAMKALTRLVLTHGAVLAAGQGAGVDLSHWVFLSPLTYSGGPALDVVTNVPKSLDFESQRGAEARSELRRAVFPGMLPGGELMYDLYDGIAHDSPDVWKRIMGFAPLKEKGGE